MHRPSKSQVIVSAATFMAATSFLVLALLPAADVAYFKDPLRGLLTGTGLLGIGIPLCIAGASVRDRYINSPYFEGRFIAGFIGLFGYICVVLALVSMGFGLYGLACRLSGQVGF